MQSSVDSNPVLVVDGLLYDDNEATEIRGRGIEHAVRRPALPALGYGKPSSSEPQSGRRLKNLS